MGYRDGRDVLREEIDRLRADLQRLTAEIAESREQCRALRARTGQPATRRPPPLAAAATQGEIDDAGALGREAERLREAIERARDEAKRLRAEDRRLRAMLTLGRPRASGEGGSRVIALFALIAAGLVLLSGLALSRGWLG